MLKNHHQKQRLQQKKQSKPIIKSASAKKSAKSGAKKAAPKKLANTNKTTALRRLQFRLKNRNAF